MEIVSAAVNGNYDYYHFNKNVSADERKVRTPWYYRDLSTEEINKNNNIPNKDSEGADICRSVSEKLESVAASNRSKYGSADNIKNAVWAKYTSKYYFDNYTREEREALARAEIQMTLYGKVGYKEACIIAKIKGDYTHNTLGRTEDKNRAFNASMLGQQIGNVFSNNGIDVSLLKDDSFVFSVNGMSKELTILLLSDKGNSVTGSGMISEMTKALNTNDNAKNLFYNLLYDYNKQGIIPDDELAKWSLFSDFQNVTGLDIRDFKQTDKGFVNADGQYARDIYKEALKHSNKVAAEYKGMAYDYFTKLEKDALKYDISKVPDLTLSVEYQNGYVKLQREVGTFDLGA